MPEDNELLQQGIAAVQAGHTAAARLLLTNILQVDTRNEQAWLWLSGAVTTDAERKYCLEQIVLMNPQSMIAKRGLASLPDVPSASPLQQPAPPVPSAHPETPTRIQNLAYSGTIRAMDMSPNGLYLAAVDRDFRLIVWRISDHAKQWTVEDVLITELAYSPDGKYIATNEDLEISFRDAHGGAIRRTIKIPLHQMVYDGNGKTIATLDRQGKTIKMFDTTNGRLLRTISCQADFIDSLDYAPNAQLVAATDTLTGIFIWDTKTGHLLYRKATGCDAFQFHPNSQLFADASGTSLYVRLATDGTITATLEGHPTLITRLRWSRNGDVLASLDHHATIRLWSYPKCRLIAALRGTKGGILDFHLHPQGDMLAILNEDGTLEYRYLNSA